MNADRKTNKHECVCYDSETTNQHEVTRKRSRPFSVVLCDFVVRSCSITDKTVAEYIYDL